MHVLITYAVLVLAYSYRNSLNVHSLRVLDAVSIPDLWSLDDE